MWNNITWFLAGSLSVLVMAQMFVDLLRWLEHHQKVRGLTGKMLTHQLDKVGVTSLKLDGY